jgi:enamine deaminase RidA (YjgF/YER057c/UK114 family)
MDRLMTVTRQDSSNLLSKCVSSGNLVMTAGLVPDDLSADIKGQTKQILTQIDKYLAAAGTSKSQIMYAQIWVSDITNRDALNEVWLAWVDPANLPARACVEAKLANPKILVEIQVTAAK